MVKYISKCAVLAATVVLALAAMAVAEVATGDATATAQTIRDIQVSGNKRVEPETVKSYLTFSVGDQYSEKAADDSFKALFDTGLFSDVNVSFSSQVVTVSVEENPVINKVAYEGNDELDDSTLSQEGQLRPRSVYTRAAAQADVQRILNVYRASGYYDAQVEAKIIKLPYNRVNLVYEINEGEDTKVESINFVGNKAFSDSQLRDVISTSESSLLSFLNPTDIYDSNRLNLDRALLRKFYLENGYADVRIISAVADLAPDGEGFYITITLEEGPQYTFGDVSIQSELSGLDPADVRDEVLVESGDTFNALRLDKSVEKMTLAASDLGFPFARVRKKVSRDPISLTIDVDFVIDQGPRVYVGRINFYGNVRTREYVLRQEMLVSEGDAYNKQLVEQSRKRLQAKPYVKSVEISKEQGSASDRVDLNVNVVEQASGEFGIAGGYSSLEGVIGEISYTERNFMGRGQYVQLKFSGSFERAQVDFSFTEPRFLGRNMSAGFDVFHKELDYSDEAGYMKRTSGGQVRFGFLVAEDVVLTTNYSFKQDDIYDVHSDASQVVQDQAGVSQVSAVGYTLAYDTRNLKRNPTSGVYLALNQEFAGVGGSVNYLRSTAEARGYYPVTDGITLVGRLIGGHIEGLQGDDVRLTDAFYKGNNLIRGFESTGLGPRDQNDDALGGKTFYGANVELRFPFPLIPDELGLSGAVFADAGSVFGTDADDDDCNAGGSGGCKDSDSIRSSVGASLLWDSPVGPLRADFSYVLSSEDFDEEEMFGFGATTKF
ncbi:MAG: outer membrane protein assembly factor BamA [Dichotomicrobium sp.]